MSWLAGRFSLNVVRKNPTCRIGLYEHREDRFTTSHTPGLSSPLKGVRESQAESSKPGKCQPMR